MQAIILAGGKGIRMGNETLLTPKPMIRIGKMPILWHIMKNLYAQGISKFLILGGYRVDVIRDFFRNYREYNEDISFYNWKWDYFIENKSEDWRVGVMDTGEDTPTAGRLLQAEKYINGPFLLTYGDGVANVDINKLEQASQNNIITVTAVHAPGRFGALEIDNGKIVDFREKPLAKDWINGGFWYLQPKALDYFLPHEMLEMGGIQRAMVKDAVGAYQHEGFWYPMDTGRDKEYLTELWLRGDAPWKNWR
jgi:glucose-1-phosphate cytidylyltransferase